MGITNREINYNGIAPFHFSLHYVELNASSPQNQFDSHIHPQCEIYLNLSGDVSFMVEDHIYPISPGSIIITRPYEYHRCIYLSNALHRHFWVLMSSGGNEALLKLFFDRPAGMGNLIVLSPRKSRELLELFHTMLRSQEDEVEKHLRFLTMLSILQTGNPADLSKTNTVLPSDLAFALTYISDNLSNAISIRELAVAAHVSVNTLERHFLNCLQMTPNEFIKEKRLMYAAQLLKQGRTVAEASAESGFSDYSHFIASFRRVFGLTPLQYKKHTRR